MNIDKVFNDLINNMDLWEFKDGLTSYSVITTISRGPFCFKRIRVFGSSADDYLNGIEISNEYLDKVFEIKRSIKNAEEDRARALKIKELEDLIEEYYSE